MFSIQYKLFLIVRIFAIINKLWVELDDKWWISDVGYLDNNSYKVHQPTAWIPLLDANEYNGCMEVQV